MIHCTIDTSAQTRHRARVAFTFNRPPSASDTTNRQSTIRNCCRRSEFPALFVSPIRRNCCTCPIGSTDFADPSVSGAKWIKARSSLLRFHSLCSLSRSRKVVFSVDRIGLLNKAMRTYSTSDDLQRVRTLDSDHRRPEAYMKSHVFRASLQIVIALFLLEAPCLTRAKTLITSNSIILITRSSNHNHSPIYIPSLSNTSTTSTTTTTTTTTATPNTDVRIEYELESRSISRSTCGRSLSRVPKIVGGVEAHQGEFPWLVRMLHADSPSERCS
jgi:hypothetical protein